MNELPEDLARAFRVLDERAARRAERVDPERVAARVLERLRAGESPSPRVFSIGHRLSAIGFPLALAATLAVLAVGGSATLMLMRGAAPHSTAVPVAMQALDSLSLGQLETVLRAAGNVQVAEGAAYVATSAALDDLDEQQLRAVLQAMQQERGGSL